jgi:hypothetical protein
VRGAAVVVNHNSGGDLADCLKALLAQEAKVRIVVVDCASTDLSRAVAESPPAGVESLLLEENAGFAGGCNAGLEAVASTVDVVGFFNPDCFLAPGYLRVCIEVLAQEERVAGVAGRLTRPGGTLLDSCGQTLTPVLLRVRDRGYGRVAHGTLLEGTRVMAACGAAMVFRVAALREVAVAGRVFPDEFFAFWEDLDLGWRLRNAGWDIAYEPGAEAVHRRGGTAGPGEGRLIFRRSAPLAACVLLNRWATLLRNCHWADLLPRLPLLLLADLAIAGAVSVRRPAVVAALGRGLPRLRAAARQRGSLSQRRLGDLL